MAVSLEYKIQQTFCMIRSGMLPDDIIQGMVTEMYPHRKPVEPVGMLLSALIDDYVKANEDKWTHKTKIEIMNCNRLILDVMNNLEVKAINRQMVLDFKDIMVKVLAGHPSSEISANRAQGDTGSELGYVWRKAATQSSCSLEIYLIWLNSHCIRKEEISRFVIAFFILSIVATSV